MWKLKVDDKGNVVVQDGKAVYVDDTGKDVAFDPEHATGTITRLNGEAKSHREGKEQAEAKLKAFEGITDPAVAIKAMATVKNLDDKTLVDAGKVEEIKQAAIAATKAQYEPFKVQAETLEKQLIEEKIGGAFSRSPLIVGDKAILAIPADLVQARFGKQFALKDGKVIATDVHGNQIYSKARPGEAADFDEALSIIVDQYAHKDSILKSSGANGGGSGNNGNPGAGGKKTYTRAEFEKMPPAEKAVAASTATITD